MTYQPTNTFVVHTSADDDAVNTNFTDLATYINNNVIVKDASLAFTQYPSAPADPAAANEFARKSYVDAKYAAAIINHLAWAPNTWVQFGPAGIGTPESPAPPNSVFPATTQTYIQAGYATTTITSGKNYITLPQAWPTGPLIAFQWASDAYSGGSEMNLRCNYIPSLSTTTQLCFSNIAAHTNNPPANGSVRVIWLAFGY